MNLSLHISPLYTGMYINDLNTFERKALQDIEQQQGSQALTLRGRLPQTHTLSTQWSHSLCSACYQNTDPLSIQGHWLHLVIRRYGCDDFTVMVAEVIQGHDFSMLTCNINDCLGRSAPVKGWFATFTFSCEGSNTLLRNDCNVSVSGNYLSVMTLRSLLLFLDWVEGIMGILAAFQHLNWAFDVPTGLTTNQCMLAWWRTRVHTC